MPTAGANGERAVGPENGRIEVRRALSIPNRFVALVPWGRNGADAHSMADGCTKAVRAAWRRLAGAVYARLDRLLSAIDPD